MQLKTQVCRMGTAAVKPPARRPRPPTFDRFVIHTVIAATGWQSVYFEDHEGRHFLGPCHVLALVTRRTRCAGTGRLLPPLFLEDEAEGRELVGMAYLPDSGWEIVDDASNNCGLLSPDMTLQDFEAARGCWHAVVKVSSPTSREGA